MSHFILLRQRIKVIETIKKTTGAMRLISMSLHSRLRNQKNILEAYSQEIKRIASSVSQNAPAEEALPPQPKSPRIMPLIILIGSQKGLCGAFNENLFQFFQKNHPLDGSEKIITVGKYATDFIKKLQIKPFRSFDQFGLANFVSIANQLKKVCIEAEQNAIVFSNSAPTFFSQKPQIQTISVPFANHHDFDAYLNALLLKATFLHILHESLLAEQAARFVAMDMAYRNAQDILNQTKLDYNKTRQAYVTRELIELSGGMISQE